MATSVQLPDAKKEAQEDWLAKLDQYSVHPKAATRVGGLLSIFMLAAAAAYGVWQVIAYMHSPFVVTSNVEWTDTQGPFFMMVQCVSTAGCFVSNRHNDSLSSNYKQVDPKQIGCTALAGGEIMIINATYTHNPLSGLVALWDPKAPVIPGQPQGAGLAIRSQTNCPSCPGGIALMWAPALAGSYLVNYVQTTNDTSDAPERTEWFITSGGRDGTIYPEMTPCAERLDTTQAATYVQASIKLQSYWFNVAVSRQAAWLSLIGNIGGAMQLLLSIGAFVLMGLEVTSIVQEREWMPKGFNVRRFSMFGGSHDGHAGGNRPRRFSMFGFSQDGRKHAAHQPERQVPIIMSPIEDAGALGMSDGHATIVLNHTGKEDSTHVKKGVHFTNEAATPAPALVPVRSGIASLSSSRNNMFAAAPPPLPRMVSPRENGWLSEDVPTEHM